MSGFLSNLFLSPQSAMLKSIGKSQPILEFDMNGKILTANHQYLKMMGYDRQDVVGKNHGSFLDAAERKNAQYCELWKSLKQGQFQSGVFKRIAKGGREVWIQASYNPVLNKGGEPVRVIKLATDVTAQNMEHADYAGQIIALRKAQGVVEFTLDGVIIAANDIFLETFGYSLAEISGARHEMFVDDAERASSAYVAFWDSLRAGKSRTAEFKRIGKGGKTVWLQASYCPIHDQNGKPWKIILIATDVSDQKLRSANFVGQIEAIDKSQAVIEFDLAGYILKANDNFLAALGYTIDEIHGKHHSMLLAPDLRDESDYREFWAALNRGEFRSGEFHRIGKNGKNVWIQASYNPVLDLNGTPFKIVKFAADVTAQVMVRKQSEHISRLLEDVATGAEQMSASVIEISDTMELSRRTAETTFGKVEATDALASRFATAAESMGGIVATIKSIAGQINLLALNATIESARAGEAGRGFAVVASEVKTLADQAQTATDRIAHEIGALLDVSTDVVGGLGAIKDSIEEVRRYVIGTTAAVQEQSVVSKAMSSNIRKAAVEARKIV